MGTFRAGFGIMVVFAALVGGREASPASVDDSRPAATTGLGRLQGDVTLGHELTTRRMKFSLYPDANRAGRRNEAPSSADEFQNVVVYLERVPEGAASSWHPTAPARMEQEGMSFKPHVLAVMKGTVIEFPNRDLLFHNVFSLSKAASFDLGRYPQDASKSLKLDKPGIVQVFCHIHSDMSGIIVVLDNPFYTSPGSDGHFVIEGIPPGDYRVAAWHERARLTTKKVRIEAGKASVIDFNIPLTGITDGG